MSSYPWQTGPHHRSCRVQPSVQYPILPNPQGDGLTTSSKSWGVPVTSGHLGWVAHWGRYSPKGRPHLLLPWAPQLYPDRPPQHTPGDGKNAIPSQRGSLLAQDWHGYNWLHQDIPHMHQAQGFPTGSANAAQRHPQWPMAEDCSWLLPPQRQRVPPHLHSV